MFRNIALIVVLMITSTPVLAEKLYLNCTLVEGPTVKVTDLYKVAPKTLDIMIEDFWKQGAVGAIVSQPKTWVIDTLGGTITSPEGNGNYKQTQANDAAVEGVFRSESGTLKTFSLNRLNRLLSLSLHYAPHSMDKWQTTHGKSFPLDWSWRQSCKSIAPM